MTQTHTHTHTRFFHKLLHAAQTYSPIPPATITQCFPHFHLFRPPQINDRHKLIFFLFLTLKFGAWPDSGLDGRLFVCPTPRPQVCGVNTVILRISVWPSRLPCDDLTVKNG